MAQELLGGDAFGDHSAQGNEWNTIMGLRSFSGLQLTDDDMRYVCSNSSLFLRSPVEAGMARIIGRYHDVCARNNQIAFQLSSGSLISQVEYLDVFSKNALGFHYPEALKRDCELVVPRAIADNAPLEQLVFPLQVWRLNCTHLQCHMLDVALVLSLMNGFVRSNKDFARADWTPLLLVVRTSLVDQLPLAVNDAGIQMLNNVKRK